MPKPTSRGFPVRPCTVTDMDEKPIGNAESARVAARMINQFLEGRDGDDYGLSEEDITFSAEHGAYFIAEYNGECSGSPERHGCGRPLSS